MSQIGAKNERASEPLAGCISVVIPVYNEALNLKPLHEELTGVLEQITGQYELIFVDDGSSDPSAAVLSDLHTADKNVKAILLRRNFGQTTAFAAGFDYAHGEIIVTMDADGQNDPRDIPKLLEKMQTEGYDAVVGWRVNRQESFIRRTVSAMANLLINWSTRLSIHDRGCSLKVFKSELVKSLHLYGQLHRFIPELASVAGAFVGEVPVNDRSRKFGESKYGALTRTPRVLLDLFTVFFLVSFFGTPMRFFGSAGLLSAMLGGGLAGFLTLAKLYHGITGGWAGFHAYQIGNRPLLTMAVLLLSVGVQFLMMGILGEMIMRTYYEVQGKPIYSIKKILE